MRRPQSAKPGHRHNNQQPSFEQFRDDHSGIHKHNRKHHVKLMKPDLTTNDFGRIMPKKIHQDKQRLYSQALQLKQTMNQVNQENIRLKTRITILEKQKDKMNRYLEANSNQGKGNSRLNMYSGGHLKSANNIGNDNKENLMVRNLKKMVRESKQQNQFLKQQNQKIKKAIKYTRINQLQIQRKMLLDENQRINRILVELNEQLADKDDYEHEIQQLKNYLQQQVQANRQLSQNNQKYLEYIEELQEKLKSMQQKKQERQKKMQRENGLLKRKNNEFIKINDDLRKQLRQYRDRQAQQKKKQKSIMRPVSSNPYSRAGNSNNRNQVGISLNTKDFQQIKSKNQQLQKQLQQMKIKLQRSQTQKYNLQKIQSQPKQQQHKKLPTQQKSLKDQYQFQESHQQNNAQFILTEDKKVQKEVPADDYDDQFQKQEKIQAKDKYDLSYDDKFEDQSNIIDKDKNTKKQKKSKNDNKKDKKVYKPDKKILTQIKQLLTYRMKAQRYPYKELQKDINASGQKQFPIPDLKSMMGSQPFYLTQNYINIFLQYCQQSEQIDNNKPILVQNFLQKIQKLIKDFDLLPEEEEEQILLRIAQMTTQYPEELAGAFENIKNGPETCQKAKLIQMFKKLELGTQYIQAIIAELSLCSEDLDHLNFRGFFQRFFIEQDGEQQETMNGAINQQQIQSSGQDRQKVPQYLNANKQIPKIDQQQEYEDDKVNFILDDQGQLSMGMKNNDLPDEQDMVSDDGRI